MKPVAILAALAIVGGVAALVITNRSSSKAATGKAAVGAESRGESRAAARGEAQARGEAPRLPGADSGEAGTTAGAPGDPDEAAKAAREARRAERLTKPRPGQPTRRYTREDGSTVSDFRLEPGEERIPDPRKQRNAKPALARDIKFAIRHAAQPHIKRCANTMPEGIVSAGASAQVDLDVTVAEGRATIAKAVVRSRGIEDSGARALSACTVDALAQVSVDAPDQPDGAHYRLSLPFRLSAP